MSAPTLGAAKDSRSSKMPSKCPLLADKPANFGNLQLLLAASMFTVNFTCSVTFLCCARRAFNSGSDYRLFLNFFIRPKFSISSEYW